MPEPNFRVDYLKKDAEWPFGLYQGPCVILHEEGEPTHSRAYTTPEDAVKMVVEMANASLQVFGEKAMSAAWNTYQEYLKDKFINEAVDIRDQVAKLTETGAP